MSNKSANKKNFAPMGILFALLGFALFSYFVWKAGIGDILNGIRRLGLGFLIVVAIAGTRKVVRALAWMRCFEAPARIGFRDALIAVLAADALGTVMPFGMVVSEPTKAALVRHRAPLLSGLSAIAIENLFYSLSVAVFIFCGMSAMLLSFPLPKALRIAAIGAIVGVIVVLLLAYVIILNKWRFLSGLVEFLYGRGIARHALEPRREHVRTLENSVYGFYDHNKSSLVLIFALEMCFHLAGVLEGYTTLAFIGMAPTLLGAFILESVNRVITVVFKFVPLRLGVDEAGSGAVAKILNLGQVNGITLAIVRKGRDLVWAGVGVAILIHKGLSPVKVAEESQAAVAEEVESAV
jgi:hypothetical protein